MDFKLTIQKIKASYDIVDYIKVNGVELESSGSGRWKGLCPFHSEKTPSFVVSEDFQSYNCFGCGESGDILSFAQHTHTVNFVEAMKMLAEEKNIDIGEFNNNEPSHDINGIRQVLEDAREFFRKNYLSLPSTHPAKKEVEKRNLDINNEIYGYSLESPNDLYKYLKSKGHSDENIKDSKLVMFFDDGRQPWDFFHGRLMITLSDYLGRPVSFTSRKIFEDDKMKGKYVNGKESPIFIKKSNLFGADKAKRAARAKRKVYILEGQFDEIAMRENGVENVVATSGTAFTDEHANLLLRMVGSTGELVFIMDGDSAGLESMMKIFESHPILHSQSTAVHLEDGKDPCDYIIEKGIEGLLEKTKESKPLHDFVIYNTLDKLGGEITEKNRHSFVSEIARYAKYAESSHIRDIMLNKASVISALSISNIRDIYDSADIKINKPRKKETKEEKLDIKVSLNSNSDADKSMFVALALLVREPKELLEVTPNKIHKKFQPFINELKEKFAYYKSEGVNWRFIAEDYTDVDFAKALQRKEFLEDPREDIESTKSHYIYLFEQANNIYEKEYISMKRARALSSLVDTTDPYKIAEALKLYQEAH